MDRYVIQAPNPILEKISKEVVDFKGIQGIVKKMLDVAFAIRTTIYEYPRGFEMAAPQIGESYRIIMLQGDYNQHPENIETIFMVNPHIIKESDFFYNWEDCLSVKDMRGYLKRCGRISIEYSDLEGYFQHKEFQGNMACDIQHGVDHLNGRLFFERDMKYLIPLKVYRPLKEQGIDVLNEYVSLHYHLFNPNQNFSQSEMEKYGLIHPRQSQRK